MFNLYIKEIQREKQSDYHNALVCRRIGGLRSSFSTTDCASDVYCTIRGTTDSATQHIADYGTEHTLHHAS